VGVTNQLGVTREGMCLSSWREGMKEWKNMHCAGREISDFTRWELQIIWSYMKYGGRELCACSDWSYMYWNIVSYCKILHLCSGKEIRVSLSCYRKVGRDYK